MNNRKLFVLGLVSSLLSASGFASAAAHFDPVARLAPPTLGHAVAPINACTAPCDLTQARTELSEVVQK